MRIKNIKALIAAAKEGSGVFGQAISSEECRAALVSLGAMSRSRIDGILSKDELLLEVGKAADVLKAATEAAGVVWTTEGNRLQGHIDGDLVASCVALDAGERVLHAVLGAVREGR